MLLCTSSFTACALQQQVVNALARVINPYETKLCPFLVTHYDS